LRSNDTTASKPDEDIREIKQSSVNKSSTETENPNVTPEQTVSQNKNVPESDISNDTSNSDESNNTFLELSENVDQETGTLVPLESNKSQCSTSPLYTESKSLEDKEIFDFLVRVDKEEVKNMMVKKNREKKLLRNNEDQDASREPINQTQSTISSEIKIPYNQKVEQGLICELSTLINKKGLSNSISDKQILENMLDGDDSTLGSASHLAHLFDKAKKTGQKEILRWYCYSEEFEKKNLHAQTTKPSNTNDILNIEASIPTKTSHAFDSKDK
ncbi:1931_t:CDS:2, partial [Diversispora eburnea]